MREETKIARRKAKQLAIIEAIKTQKPVKNMTINIEWVKSRTWGMNPHATGRIEHHDGSYSSVGPFTCSGCGYDKESTVIADIFNAALAYKLYKRRRNKAPYGVYYYGGKYREEETYLHGPTFNGGVGTSCYHDIAKFIGGTFRKVASGKNFDIYEYTDRRP